jgi:hypothetical protein
MLTASTTEVVDEPPGTQYRFAHWRLPTGETMADPQLRVTVKWGGEIVAYFDTFYLLTVFSEHGTPEGSEYYKADTRASWDVTPTEVEMSGVLGFLGGKLRTKNVEGTEIMTSPKTVSISWQPDYKMPILIITLAFLFIGLASYLGYIYTQKGKRSGPCGAPCSRCGKGNCSIPLDHPGPHDSQHPPCTATKPCPNCDTYTAHCSLCSGHKSEHNFPLPHPCGKSYTCKCGAKLVCSADCHGNNPNIHNAKHPCGAPCPKCGKVTCIKNCPRHDGEHEFPEHECK